MRHKKRSLYSRVGLTNKQVRFLDQLVSVIRYDSGKKFTRSQVVSALFKALKEMKLNVGGVKTERELSKKFIQACKRKD